MAAATKRVRPNFHQLSADVQAVEGGKLNAASNCHFFGGQDTAITGLECSFFSNDINADRAAAVVKFIKQLAYLVKWHEDHLGCHVAPELYKEFLAASVAAQTGLSHAELKRWLMAVWLSHKRIKKKGLQKFDVCKMYKTILDQELAAEDADKLRAANQRPDLSSKAEDDDIASWNCPAPPVNESPSNDVTPTKLCFPFLGGFSAQTARATADSSTKKAMQRDYPSLPKAEELMFEELSRVCLGPGPLGPSPGAQEPPPLSRRHPLGSPLALLPTRSAESLSPLESLPGSFDEISSSSEFSFAEPVVDAITPAKDQSSCK